MLMAIFAYADTHTKSRELTTGTILMLMMQIS